MKRLSAFIILLIYFVTTTGATLQLHYCMGKFAGWSIAGNSAKKCGKCGMKQEPKEDNGCCKDEHKLIKIEDDQKANYLSFDISKPVASAPVVTENTFTYAIPETKELLPQTNAPPRSCNTSIHIANCVFRI